MTEIGWRTSQPAKRSTRTPSSAPFRFHPHDEHDAGPLDLSFASAGVDDGCAALEPDRVIVV